MSSYIKTLSLADRRRRLLEEDSVGSSIQSSLTPRRDSGNDVNPLIHGSLHSSSSGGRSIHGSLHSSIHSSTSSSSGRGRSSSPSSSGSRGKKRRGSKKSAKRNNILTGVTVHGSLSARHPLLKGSKSAFDGAEVLAGGGGGGGGGGSVRSPLSGGAAGGGGIHGSTSSSVHGSTGSGDEVLGTKAPIFRRQATARLLAAAGNLSPLKGTTSVSSSVGARNLLAQRSQAAERKAGGAGSPKGLDPLAARFAGGVHGSFGLRTRRVPARAHSPARRRWLKVRYAVKLGVLLRGARETLARDTERLRAEAERKGVVFEVDSLDHSVPVWQQGNLELYDKDALLKRRFNREADAVIAAVGVWWALAQKNELTGRAAGLVHMDEYLAINAKVYRALVAPFDEDDAAESGLEDWGRDAPPGEFYMGYEHFFSSIFELADNWTDTTDPDDYAAFLLMLFETVTVEDGKGSRTWAEDYQIPAPEADPEVEQALRHARHATLTSAIEAQCLPEVIRLLQRGENPNSRTRGGDGHTAVHTCARAGTVEILRELLLAGADPDIKTRKGRRSIDIAKLNANDDMVSLLRCINEEDAWNLAKVGDTIPLRVLLALDRFDVKKIDADGNTLLHFAALNAARAAAIHEEELAGAVISRSSSKGSLTSNDGQASGSRPASRAGSSASIVRSASVKGVALDESPVLHRDPASAAVELAETLIDVGFDVRTMNRAMMSAYELGLREGAPESFLAIVRPDVSVSRLKKQRKEQEDSIRIIEQYRQGDGTAAAGGAAAGGAAAGLARRTGADSAIQMSIASRSRPKLPANAVAVGAARNAVAAMAASQGLGPGQTYFAAVTRSVQGGKDLLSVVVEGSWPIDPTDVEINGECFPAQPLREAAATCQLPSWPERRAGARRQEVLAISFAGRTGPTAPIFRNAPTIHAVDYEADGANGVWVIRGRHLFGVRAAVVVNKTERIPDDDVEVAADIPSPGTGVIRVRRPTVITPFSMVKIRVAIAGVPSNLFSFKDVRVVRRTLSANLPDAPVAAQDGADATRAASSRRNPSTMLELPQSTGAATAKRSTSSRASVVLPGLAPTGAGGGKKRPVYATRASHRRAADLTQVANGEGTRSSHSSARPPSATSKSGGGRPIPGRVSPVPPSGGRRSPSRSPAAGRRVLKKKET